jgi:hypothetical protein
VVAFAADVHSSRLQSATESLLFFLRKTAEFHDLPQ